MKDKKISPMSVDIKDDFHFQDEIKTTVGNLRNPKQWRILELLLSNDDKLSYTQLRMNLGFSSDSKGDLNYHLNELEKNGWIYNESEKGVNLEDRFSSYYKISKFGLKLIEGMMKSVKRSSYQIDPLEEIRKLYSQDQEKNDWSVSSLSNEKMYEHLQSSLARLHHRQLEIQSITEEEEIIKKLAEISTDGFENRTGISNQATLKIMKRRKL